MKYLLLICMIIPALAFAQDAPKPPLEISADEALEWHRNDKFFIAKTNALAKQGTASIAGQTLKALYRENKETGNDFDIYQMNADIDVILTSQDSKAYGDKATYDLTKNTAIMTGDNLKIIMPEQTVTARDKFEYNTQTGEFKALGNAEIIRPTDTISADILTAFMSTDAQGKRSLDKMTADNNVTITTETERITGAYGTYNARTDMAELTGGVTITRGPNTLQGDRATVDLKTGISRIFAGNGNNNRVKGTFYPGSEKKE